MATKEPLISILVPCYNNQQYIYENLSSIFEQTYPNLEVVIGDDGSQYFDRDALETWIADHRTKNIQNVILIVQEVNRGTVANFEAMQEKSHGEMLFHIAADDVLHNENVISQLAERLYELGDQAEFLTAQTEMWDNTLKHKLKDFVKKVDIHKIQSLSPQRLFWECASRSFIPASSLYRRTLLEKVGKMSDQYRLVEDWAMHLRCLRAGVRFYFLDIPCIKHRSGGASQGDFGSPSLITLLFYKDLIRIYVNEVQPYELTMSEECLQRAVDNATMRVDTYYNKLLPRYRKGQNKNSDILQQNISMDKPVDLSGENRSRTQNNALLVEHRAVTSMEKPLWKKGTHNCNGGETLCGQKVSLSVIMPCYNVADTLERALDSVLMQETTYRYEILIINDASTDQTLEIAQEYAKQFPQIQVFSNEINSGNAKTFFKGLCHAQGDYFCVLDGDDYYTVRDKFHRQLTFLEQDVDEEYVAVTHYYVIDVGNEQVHISAQSPVLEFNYADLLQQRTGGYYHTSTYIYRNIFKGNVLRYYDEAIFRGDTPRTTFHLMYSNKKVKILNFVGSVYTFHLVGLWSGMSQIQQSQYQLRYLEAMAEIVSTDFERNCIKEMNVYYAKNIKTALDQPYKYSAVSINKAITIMKHYTDIYAFSQLQYVLKNLYYSEYVDTLLTTLGEIYRINHPEKVQRKTNSSQIGIVIGVLNPQGGGVFKEIKEICQIYANKQIAILVTNMISIPIEVYKEFSNCENISIYCPEEQCADKLGYFHDCLLEVCPEKLYVYTSHDDVYGPALVQNGPCKNVTLFSFDHGYICGLSNPNLDVIVAKRPLDYQLLRKKFGDRTCFIPAWDISGKYGKERYEPFCAHESLITASGAARFYKIDGGRPHRYIDLIVSLLKKTGGKHYHFGVIPDKNLKEIMKKLKEEQIRPENFVYLPWVEDIPQFLLENHVDIFIEPFPTVSYKLSLAVLSCGVPIVSYNGNCRMSKMDFIYEGAPVWNTEEEFVELISGFTEADLQKHSEKALAYYRSTHSLDVLRDYIIHERSFAEPSSQQFTDNTIMDVKDLQSVFGNYVHINIMQHVATISKAAPDGIIERRMQEAAKQVEEIKKSHAYRIGKRIVLTMKKILNGLRIRHYDLTSPSVVYANALDELESILNSRSLHIGRTVTAPYRWIRYCFHTKKD